MRQQTDPFSPREQAVINNLLQGKGNKQIARSLGISVRTVEFHLTNIYARLGVSSRTEAVLRLAERDLRESTVETRANSGQNSGNPFLERRIIMKHLPVMAGAGILMAALAMLVALANRPAPPAGKLPDLAAVVTIAPQPVAAMTSSPGLSAAGTAFASASPTQLPTSSASRREQLLAEMHGLVNEYDSAVQAERSSSSVEVSRDPDTGEEIFRFTGARAERLFVLFDQLNQDLQALNREYEQVYAAEVGPTPFPTQQTEKQNEDYYNALLQQFQPNYEQELQDATYLPIYDPGEGKYQPRLVGDAAARIDITARALEALRLAPLQARIDQGADMAHIRQVLGDPELQLSYAGTESLPNAHGLQAAAYRDASGVTYLVTIGSGRLAQFYPDQRTEIPAFEGQSMAELRPVAERFAEAASLRFAELRPVLSYQESCKGSLCFFDWRYMSKDWSGTDWALMPPLLQVGVLANGQVATYINTLDMVEGKQGH